MRSGVMKNQTMKCQQKGAVLIMTLVLVAILTVVISSNVNNVLIEEKVVINQKDRLIAMEGAESALREAELWIENLSSEREGSTSGETGVWATDAPKISATNTEWWLENDLDWWNSNATRSQLSGITKKPLYVIETLDYVQDSLVVGQQKDERGRTFFRITARGSGGTDTARVLLQTSFTRRF